MAKHPVRMRTQARANAQIIGQAILAARTERAWTQDHLGKVVGVGPRVISSLERGEGSAAWGTALSVMDALGIDVLGLSDSERAVLEGAQRRGETYLPRRVYAPTREVNDDF